MEKKKKCIPPLMMFLGDEECILYDGGPSSRRGKRALSGR
jgi:hypothetical protein